MPEKKTAVLSTIARTAKDYAPLFFQIGSIIFLLFSAYLTSRIAPLAEDIKTVVSRVDAVESEVDDRKPLVERFIITEQKVVNQEKDLQEIKGDVKDIKRYLLEGKR